ncbi:MAG: protein ral secretion pathway protein [Candidatus Parcubacteria bacterium]|jgi:prepilin-type N-terminal cleavage/methylation domain-containing protein
MKQKGFSIVELLTVLAIIGFLFTIVIGSTTASRSRARDNRRITDLKEIQLGLALYYDVNKVYPVGTDVSILVTKLVTDKYLPEIPNDPAGGTYEYTGSATTYCLGAKLEMTSAPSDNNASCSSKPSGSIATYKVSK